MAFYDGLLKAMGRPTQTERDDAATQELADINKGRDPASVFASRNAAGLSELTDRDLRKSIPMLAGDPIPAPGVQRTALVATTLKVYGDTFIERGEDNGLTPPMARAVREHAIKTVDVADITKVRGSKLIEVLGDRATDIGKITSNYLASGRAHETALDNAALEVVKDPIRLSHLRSNTGQVLEPLAPPKEADRGQGWDPDQADRKEALRWTREALATEVALARGGALKPNEIVRAAHGNPAQAKMLLDVEKSSMASAMIRVHPNFAVGQKTQPHEMAALVDRFISSSDRPQMNAREDRDRQSRAQMDMADRVLAPIGRGPAYSAGAAMARNHSQGAER